MPTRISIVIAASTALLEAGAAAAQEASSAMDPVSMGTRVGMAIVILLAVLICLSVVAKLLIVFGIVPRRPDSGFHVLVHGAANFVGGLTRPKPRRRPGSRFEDR